MPVIFQLPRRITGVTSVIGWSAASAVANSAPSAPRESPSCQLGGGPLSNVKPKATVIPLRPITTPALSKGT